MTFIPTPHCARAVVGFSINSTYDFGNVLHFTKTNFVEADMLALAAAIDGEMNHLLPQLSSSCTYLDTTVYDIRTVGGGLVVDNSSTANGSIVDQPMAPQVAMVLTLRTATRGRSGRGRVYIGGWPENNFESLAFSAAAIAAAGAWAAALEAAINAAGWVWVIRSIQQDGVALNPAATRPVTSYEVRNNKAATQRRRQDRP